MYSIWEQECNLKLKLKYENVNKRNKRQSVDISEMGVSILLMVYADL